MDNQANFFRGMNLQWAGSRERNLASGRGGAFFLTSLFIELIDPAGRVLSVIALLTSAITPYGKGNGVRPKPDPVRAPLRPGGWRMMALGWQYTVSVRNAPSLDQDV